MLTFLANTSKFSMKRKIDPVEEKICQNLKTNENLCQFSFFVDDLTCVKFARVDGAVKRNL